MVLLKKISFILMWLFLMTMSVVQAEDEWLMVPLNQSLVLSFDNVERLAVANPEVADVVMASSNEIVIVGKAPGKTSLHVWSRGTRQSFVVEVSQDDSGASAEIKGMLGYHDVQVSVVNKNVILQGLVRDQNEKARAEKVAAAFGDKVVNLLTVTDPIQVKLEAKVVEINRQKINNLGIKWGGDDPTSAAGTFLFGQGMTNALVPGVFGNLGTYSPLNAQLSALVTSRLAKVLSKPSMVTLSGEKANILVGGQVPVPVANSNGQIMIEWKDYGIKLDIEPVVTGENLISTKLKAEVSTLDWSSDHQIGISAGLKIPPLNIRKAETAITLVSGQTMVIGGLISADNSRDQVKVPFLADIPIIGSLFKSKSFSRDETELIILVTPTLVDSKIDDLPMTKEMQELVAEDSGEEK
ncbi:MAG: type and secretion system protein [Firmicutes bacterium]|nr:type and secretion system protein [Bacillota bacterium]